MATSSGRAATATKRKSSAPDKRPAKRAKSESSDEDDGQAEILLLETEIFESKKNYNNIAKLIKILNQDSEDADDCVVAAISLCRVFTRLMVSGEMSKKQIASEKDAVVVKWLKERYADYKTGLLELLGEEAIAPTAFTLCMRLLKTEGLHLRSGQDSFPAVFLTDMIQVMLKADGEASIRKEFSDKYVEEYDDIRYYTLEAIEKILAEPHPSSDRKLFDNCFEILNAIESVPDTKEELEDFYITTPEKSSHPLLSLTKHKKHAQGAWLALMSLHIDKDQRKSLLRNISTTIAPWFMKPELLMDFLTDSYDAGGSTSLLALSGVFYLIQQRNLDYPSFYKKLYSLLDSDILHSKHRSRFFRLMDTFLASTHLPAQLVASFLKRLSRLILNAPPSGVVTVMPWIYNLLKAHPTTTFMIHRVTRDPTAKEIPENEGMDDPFDMEEEDPMETKAIDSCLWEIVTLQSHYHPNVATLAKIISEQFTKNAYNLEDFLDHSYGSMIEAELAKDVKKIPVIEFEIPKRIFLKHDAALEVEDSLLVKLWEIN